MNRQKTKTELYHAPWYVVIGGFGVYIFLQATNNISKTVIQKIVDFTRVGKLFAKLRRKT